MDSRARRTDALRPPVRPMLGRRTDSLPTGDEWRYEPKWDGFRALAFAVSRGVELRGRNDTDSSRYFPEVLEALRPLAAQDLVLDGELVVCRDGRPDFEALMLRVHPAASRVARLATETPASFVAFDLLAIGGRDLRGAAYDVRRAELESVLGGVRGDAVQITPSTADPAAAAAWLRSDYAGIDGVMAKRADGRYEENRRGWLKVKPTNTADCVVAGCRQYADRPLISSLMLGLYDAHGTLHHVGVVTMFPDGERARLVDRLRPLLMDELRGHPWEGGFNLEGGSLGRLKGAPGRWTPDMGQDWYPLRPELVVEVSYDKTAGNRFRHPARLVRWRPDRDPRSCVVDQLRSPTRPVDVAELRT